MKIDKPSIVFDGKTFDSQEELEFYWWCQEAEEDGLLRSFEYHSETFELAPKASIIVERRLKTKTKSVEKHLLREHVYTPDFRLMFSHGLFVRGLVRALKAGCLQDVLVGDLLKDGRTYEVWVDVKGGFSIYHDDKSFSINVKWVWHQHKVFINKVVPAKFFSTFWVPERARYTSKTKKLKSAYAGIRLRDDYWRASC